MAGDTSGNFAKLLLALVQVRRLRVTHTGDKLKENPGLLQSGGIWLDLTAFLLEEGGQSYHFYPAYEAFLSRWKWRVPE